MPTSETLPPAAPTSTDGPLPRIAGYDVLRLLGRGGMGCVYLGRDHQLGRHVAIKTLIAGADSDLVARFREEVMAVAAIDHPNVLKVHHAGESEGRPYFVMEYVEGGSLADYLAGKPQPDRRPSDAGLIASPEQAGDPWLAAWQKTVLDHAWASLREFERRTPKNPAHTLLHLRVEFPENTSKQLAEKLSAKMGAPVRADACRQILRRARLKFAAILVEEVGLGLDDPTPARVAEELAALELLDFVRDFLPADWNESGKLAEE